MYWYTIFKNRVENTQVSINLKKVTYHMYDRNNMMLVFYGEMSTEYKFQLHPTSDVILLLIINKLSLNVINK